MNFGSGHCFFFDKAPGTSGGEDRGDASCKIEANKTHLSGVDANAIEFMPSSDSDAWDVQAGLAALHSGAGIDTRAVGLASVSNASTSKTERKRLL